MKEFLLTAYELSCITGRPLPDILHDLRTGRIPYLYQDGERLISSKWLYPELKNNP